MDPEEVELATEIPRVEDTDHHPVDLHHPVAPAGLATEAVDVATDVANPDLDGEKVLPSLAR